ncbi:TPA: restriction endonuclease subunit S [Escherichia coli]|uniref:restriction endonuclease subunit S n=1 Tax=Escherichia coli TaxID=562 RepID=UPI001B1FAD27|nr:restriction endonuclease subunit S [Escherichia coli]MCZ4207927.1 restriction endonuclease subunit S [Escherichia coli]HBB0969095.1 restriction endonuclease subunit S [Escherichia coli]HBB8701495.1 restriction endonuclease subunit S [Escherichia coli]HBE4894838.1 restriction endonuclease subunit S [Escherichia coli]HBE5352658.1 restriction endonuclease subunit S [Escherichia coli]
MSEMSYLEKLLDGVEVEWLPLGEITKYEQPTKYLVKAKDYHDTYTIPVLTAGKTFILGYTNETHGIYQASKAPVIIFDDFTTANKWVDFDFKAKSSAMKMVTSCDDNKTLLKYVYYWLNTLPSEFAEGDHKRQWISNYSQKKIPIPCPDNPEKSLAIQSEIVRILDKFTALTAELTAELNMRKKQYNYYRDQLLSFDEEQEKPIYLEKLLDGVEVEWKLLGDASFFEIANNGRKPVKSSLRIAGKTPYYGANNIQDYVDGYTHDGEYVLIAEDGSASLENYSIQYATGKFWANNHVHVVRGKTRVNSRFLFHYLHIVNFIPFLTGGVRAKLTKGQLIEISVPIPCPDNTEKSLAIQAEIVRILDKFDTLTNSITEGLPREIELRQKQYEYYRDLLFSFPKPETVSN